MEERASDPALASVVCDHMTSEKIIPASMHEKVGFGIAFAASVLVAFLGDETPTRQLPLDYGAMVTVSIPLAAVWVVLFAFCLWRYRKRGLWLMVGAPFALWWPIWMLTNHLPSCYYSHNCV